VLIDPILLSCDQTLFADTPWQQLKDLKVELFWSVFTKCRPKENVRVRCAEKMELMIKPTFPKYP